MHIPLRKYIYIHTFILYLTEKWTRIRYYFNLILIKTLIQIHWAAGLTILPSICHNISISINLEYFFHENLKSSRALTSVAHQAAPFSEPRCVQPVKVSPWKVKGKMQGLFRVERQGWG